MIASSEELLDQIRNQLTAYQLNVKSDNRAHRYNINDRAEYFTIPFFKLIFGWDHLKDLNQGYIQFPGIDLGDDVNRVAIQVTSETSLAKVKDTISLFIANNYQQRFDRLVIFMIQEKQETYALAPLQTLCGNELSFNPRGDILDFVNLMPYIKSLPLDQLTAILKLLKDETGYIQASPAIVTQNGQEIGFSAPETPPYEVGLLNLIEIGFPDTLYIGDWNFTRKDLETKVRNDRKIVQKALEQSNLRFSQDWVTIERQIVTFHDLEDSTVALSKLVDEGTVTELDAKEFYENPFYRNKFVELLQRCLQQKLFRLGIQWQKDEKEYIFMPLKPEDASREVEWKDLKKNSRTVYKRIPHLKDPTRTYCHEHFAFGSRFYCLNGLWYLAITPDWFYSSDGYRPARYAIEDKRKYKKGVETNQSVSTHVRFIYSFISSSDPQDQHQLNLVLEERPSVYPYSFLWLKSLEDVTHMPRLPDGEWKPPATAGESQTPIL